MLPLLCACQSESYQETAQPQRVIKVGACLPNSNDTRAQVKYGSGVEETGETFMWNLGDEVFLFNLSNLEDNPKEANYSIKDLNDLNRKNAEFIFTPGAGHATEALSVKAGDVILAVFANEAYRRAISNIGGIITYDERNVITLPCGTEGNYPQIIVNNPNDESLNYMEGNFKMYDVVTADKDDEIPDLHFKHLSALMRVTLRNKTGVDLFPTKLEFKYPGTESFFNTTMYFSVDNMSLKVYDDGEFFTASSKPYTDNIGTTLNAKDETTDIGESILNEESYELYISTVPRIRNAQKGDSLEIHVIANHDTKHPYSITLHDFNTVIEAGKRYWFDLTATPDGKLMLTSEWEKEQQKGQGTTPPGEDNNNKDEEGDNQGGGDTSGTNE